MKNKKNIYRISFIICLIITLLASFQIITVEDEEGATAVLSFIYLSFFLNGILLYNSIKDKKISRRSQIVIAFVNFFSAVNLISAIMLFLNLPPKEARVRTPKKVTNYNVIQSTVVVDYDLDSIHKSIAERLMGLFHRMES